MQSFMLTTLMLLLFSVYMAEPEIISINVPVLQTYSTPNNVDSCRDEAMTAYAEFLLGERFAYSISQDKINVYSVNDVFEFFDEDIKKYNLYTFFDMTGNDIPELHLHSVRSYTILTYRDGELHYWYGTNGYATLLNNGAVFTEHPFGAPPHICYRYEILNPKGEIWETVSFSKYDDDYDDEYESFFWDNIEIPKDLWAELTKKYFLIGTDQIEWFSYSEIIPGELLMTCP